MFTIYDSECPVCRATKKVEVKRYELGVIEHIAIELWGYAPSENEVVIGAFCPECRIKFVVG